MFVLVLYSQNTHHLIVGAEVDVETLEEGDAVAVEGVVTSLQP